MKGVASTARASSGMNHILKCLAPAKINLWLEVLQKRSDGYHDLSTLMVPLDWGDVITLKPFSNGIFLECSDPQLPTDDTNLAYQAAKLFFSLVPQVAFDGVQIDLIKKIPVGSGLGGGSSDAAAVLKGLNFLSGGILSSRQLSEIALSLGADVPFFIEAQPALATGIGERLRFMRTSGPFPELPRFWFLLVKPDFSISTAWAYNNLELTKNRVRIKISHLQDRSFDLGKILINDLEPVSIKRFPQIGRIKRTLVREGAKAALMTGSGPTVFGVFETQREVFAVKHRVKTIWPRQYQLFTVRGKY